VLTAWSAASNIPTIGMMAVVRMTIAAITSTSE